MDFSGTYCGGWVDLEGGGGGGVERGRGISESSRRQKAKGDKGKLLEDARATRELAIDRSQMQVPTGRRMVFFFFSPFNRWHSVSGICEGSGMMYDEPNAWGSAAAG